MQDVILEGLRPGELNTLREIDHGSASIRSFDGLAAKGWLDVVGGVPLITLTGRTLLDRHDLSASGSSGLRNRTLLSRN